MQKAIDMQTGGHADQSASLEGERALRAQLPKLNHLAIAIQQGVLEMVGSAVWLRRVRLCRCDRTTLGLS